MKTYLVVLSCTFLYFLNPAFWEVAAGTAGSQPWELGEGFPLKEGVSRVTCGDLRARLWGRRGGDEWSGGGHEGPSDIDFQA